MSPETNLTSLPPDEAGFAEVAGLVSAARQQAYLAVNTSLINLYWQVGQYIIPGRFNCRTTGATIALDAKPHHSGTKQTSGGAGVLPPHGSSGTWVVSGIAVNRKTAWHLCRRRTNSGSQLFLLDSATIP